MMLDMIEMLMFLVCVLFSVAYLTVAERKTLGYLQRRLGPNAIGWYGLLQAFADAVKLLMKEMMLPKESNKYMLMMSPLMTLMTALIGWVVMPLGPAMTLGDLENGMLFSLAMGSLGVFGVLLSGWSSNSKYSFMGSIRSTAQLISYELVLTTMYIMCMMFVSTLNMTTYIETQRMMWLFMPLFPLFIMFYMSTMAETNRPPFDLVEAESELVAGFFTEYSGSPFVFFFLAEYSNLILMCASTTILFLGGYLSFDFINSIILFPFNNIQYSFIYNFIEGSLYGIALAIKLIILMFTFIWVRASFPRFTYDNLINLCWLIFLPLLFAFTLFIPCILYIFNGFSYI
uniref:NADH-ubiquinone oxidoreductase chain 1 n=2 Tax=Magnusiomyces TaxID=1095182 RepID=A0A8E5N7K4_9ASCO|nr:NADH dehydrogenase subunit 1 [Magnusiomyces ingens]YP_010180076.1 NADH dehydrogenase subunit 1 [Saprochaete ingens]AHY04910.1 NADH dehydrogenase subunit 1 [Magnusiomyces ingens]QUX32920.1 NADH dehydrogenase subunit 1 [Magnusiomyces ingens]QUX32944.1 NADH dehydrogenase subunit 1 [Saprochaete ingens]